jgi:hypothetical protein
MKCANCDADAFYVYKLTVTKDILYCAKHLPSFLENRRKAGLLQTTDTYKIIVEDGKKNLNTEETPTTTTPKKTTAKKPATKNDDNS